MIERRYRYRRGSPQRRAEDLGWVAGVVDSEGSVRFNNGTMELKIDMTNLPCLERVAAVLGGTPRPTRGGRGSIRPVHRLQYTGQRARQVLTRLLPLLVEKADQVALLLAMPARRAGQRLTDADLEQRAELRRELRRLKRVSF